MSSCIQLSRNYWLLSLLSLLASASPHAQTTPTTAPKDAAPPASHAAIAGDADRGKMLYQGCTGCHSIDQNDIGPKHRGVVGRKAGTVPDYAYSAALRASGIVWDQTTLDHWLINPSAMVPGTKMFFQLADPQDRADIIAYLTQLK